MTTDKNQTMKLKVQKREGPFFAADALQLQRALESAGKERIILAGQLILGSFESLKLNSGYVAQPARPASRGQLFKKGAARLLNVSIDKDALALVVRARQKPIFALDALLRYGQKLIGSDEFAVLGAFAASASTQVVMLHLRKGELTALTEYSLSATSSHTFEQDLHVLLERLKTEYSAASFHWCGPLSLPDSQSMTRPGQPLWTAVPAQSLTLSGKPGLVRQHGLAAAIVLLSLAGYAGALYVPYTRYVKAWDALSSESKTLQGQYTFATERLALLQARQSFFQSRKDGSQRLTRFKEVLRALADQPDLQVDNARLNLAPDPSHPVPAAASGNVADFEVLVEVPRAADITALAQSKPLLQNLSSQLGMNLRLSTSDGYRDSDVHASAGKSRPMRQYRIQGDFNHAP